MKKFLALSLFLVIASTGISQVNWKITEDDAKVNFTMEGEDFSGTIGKMLAKVSFDPTDLSTAKFSVTLDVTTLTTGNDGRDKHLQKADFFDAEQFQYISFIGTTVNKTKDGGFELVGMLTIKDVTKEEKIVFNFKEHRDGTASFVGAFDIEASAYGVTKAKKGSTGKTHIVIDVKASK